MKTQNNLFIIMMMIASSLSLRTVKENGKLTGVLPVHLREHLKVKEAYAELKQKLSLNAQSKPLLYYFDNYFLGEWSAVGYKCTEHTPLAVQRVNVRQENGRFYGIKLTGDQCVPAKKLSFEGDLPQRVAKGGVLAVLFTIGSPEAPAARQKVKKLTVVDLNTFRIGNRTYTRVVQDSNTAPAGVHLNMRPLKKFSKTYSGPNYIGLNPRKGMSAPVRRFVVVEEDVSHPANC